MTMGQIQPSYVHGAHEVPLIGRPSAPAYAQHERKDVETAAKIREALNMKHAFGDDAARKFLNLRGIDPDLTDRILTSRPEQLRF